MMKGVVLVCLIMLFTEMQFGVKPDVPFPLITQCGNVSNKCFTVADEADMECSVRGARPKVILDFMARTAEGDKNISIELVITSDGDGYTSTVITSNAFKLSPLLVLLVCKASTTIPGLFDNTESFALIQNGLVHTIPDQTTSITIQRYERMELLCTENEDAFIVWKKAIPPRYVDHELLLYSVSFGKGFIEVFAEDIILENNVSLVLPSIDVQHEGEYVCFYGDGISDGVRVYNVTVIGNPPTTVQPVQPHQSERTGLPFWVLFVVIVLFPIICGVTMVICLIEYYVFFSTEKPYQSHVVTRDGEEGTRMLDTASAVLIFMRLDYLFYGSPPPKSFRDESTLSDLYERNIRVKYYGSYFDSPIYNLDLQTGQWEVS
ncbi:hypothetical protein HOLleu_09932 [Holothuria leucospilota]|uniref:Ig-like domain-containing protein n=1 Tax=Holothuria leucospilota TaxID=206669 RepID=A0A9Q1HBD5_HOLLE|nr:hypothetical protein HOLleu_09932 [Holothuria leucospilota]